MVLLLLCSMPYCGPCHFYHELKVKINHNTNGGVNALLRAMSFLRFCMQNKQLDLNVCQCPIAGHVISTECLILLVAEIYCVNALLRAMSFLPLSLENQYLCGFQRLFLHVFF